MTNPLGTLNATVMEFEYEDELFYTILWHQWDNETAANRWQWYQAILMERLQHRTHPWKIVKLTMPQTHDNPQKKQQELMEIKKLASQIYIELASQ
jgi:hypothetical protein